MTAQPMPPIPQGPPFLDPTNPYLQEAPMQVRAGQVTSPTGKQLLAITLYGVQGSFTTMLEPAQAQTLVDVITEAIGQVAGTKLLIAPAGSVPMAHAHG